MNRAISLLARRVVGHTAIVFCIVAVVAAEPPSVTRLASPSKDVPAEWLTTAERTAFKKTPSYDETMAYCRRLAYASPWIEYQSFGTSPEGRDLVMLVASKDKTFCPLSAHGTGKPVVLIQNCIHAGECAGKDASLMMLRDIAILKTRAGLLDAATLVVIPIFSVDGHERSSPYSRINQNGPTEMGWRVTSRNLNLNRDYMKADAVEMRAWLRLYNEWNPDLHIDNHTTDGGDWQYDLTFSTDQHQAAAPFIVGWLKNTLYPRLLPALEADGHIPMAYFNLVDGKDPSKGVRSGGWFAPRLANCYVALRNRASILVETHMLKPYRTRVICHYNIMKHVLEELKRDPKSLRNAIKKADAAGKKIGEEYIAGAKLPIGIGRSEESEPFTYRGVAYRREQSDISGDTQIIYDNTTPIEIETTWHHGTKVTQTVVPPLGYIIPPQWTEVIDLALLHGLRVEQLTEKLTAEFESYRFIDVSFPTSPFEGRFRPMFKAEPFSEKRTYLPGSAVIWLNQADSKLAIHLLEPTAPDSLIAWGFFNAIFEQKEYAEHYMLEKLAREMLAADPSLRKEFENKLATDSAFSADPGARLNFFYKRSPYWDDRMNVYPVARMTSILKMKTQRVMRPRDK